MLYRIYLNLIKQRVLNSLLIIFMILSFVGTALSTNYMFRINKFKQDVDDLQDIVYTSSDELFIGDTSSASLESYFDTYEKEVKELSTLLEDEKIKETEATIYTNLIVEELDESDKITDEEMESGAYAHVEVGFNNYTTDLIEEEIDTSKIYVSKSLLDYYKVDVGDNVNLATQDYALDGMNIHNKKLSEVEIGGVINDEEDYEANEEEVYGTIFVPLELMLSLDSNEYAVNYFTYTFTADGEDINSIYDNVKSKIENGFIYNSNTEKADYLREYNDISKFFTVLLISSISLFVLSFWMLNNNIIDKRNQEFRLHTVFGDTFKRLQVQLILEKTILLLFSLILSVPMYLYYQKATYNIITNLINYTIGEGTIFQFMYQDVIRSDSSLELLYNGMSGIDVNNAVIILLVTVVIAIIICAISLVQLRINRKKITELGRVS
ncbi:MAG: hypothetical protein ACK5NF_00795 [Bacilli bacterium]